MRPFTITLIVALVALSGCVTHSAVPAADTGSPDTVALFEIDIAHDHADPALHPARAHGVTEVAAVRLADDGAHAARMLPAGDHVLVTLVTDTVGFAVVDVTDPDAPVVAGRYASTYGASEGESIAVTPDGRYAFLGIETMYSHPPVAPAVEVVSLADPANPTLLRRVPVATQPHVMTFFEADGQGVLAVSNYQLTTAAHGLLPELAAVATGVDFHAFDAATGTLTPVSAFRFDPAEETPQPFFTHDPVVVEHPVTGERLLYLAAFGGGGRILNVDDPARPYEVGHTTEVVDGAVVRHHTFGPAPGLVDDVYPTAAIPRSRAADGDAHLHLYDTADPANPRLLGAWTHPEPFEPGDAPPMNLHVPWFTEDGAWLLLPHFHAGLYVFPADSVSALEDPAPVAWWTPEGAHAPADGRAVSVVSMAVEVDGRVFALDGASAMVHVLTLDA